MTRDGVASENALARLSMREREVAELVAERITNRQIAERLSLSERTIESHLRTIFAKLGVSTRQALAVAVERDRTRSAE
jgi:DNA-binding CsgD family transcriptional regulator